MARSYRHTPAGSVCSGSNKWARSNANRKLRCTNKVRLTSLLEDFEPKVLRELSCTWCFPTDGLAFYQDWYTVEGKYRRLLREIESIINGKGNIETSWIGAKSMARSPEGLLDWLGLPRSIKTLMSVPNKQIWKYAIYLYNKDCSR